MLEILLLGAFFFANEPEQILFMLYTFMFIWGATMRASTYPPIFAPHILDVVAAAKTASEAAAKAASEGALDFDFNATLATQASPVTVASVAPRFCGRTVGEIAATCGISLAMSAYFDIRRLFPQGIMSKETKKRARKQFRLTMSWVLGITVNFISDVEDWWASQSFYEKIAPAANANAEL